jgi:hypothetical protein
MVFDKFGVDHFLSQKKMEWLERDGGISKSNKLTAINCLSVFPNKLTAVICYNKPLVFYFAKQQCKNAG